MSLRLAAFLAEATLSPEGDVRVTGLRRLAGGASRELWSLDAEIAVGAGSPERLALVLRRDPPGRVGEGDLPLEFRLLEAAAAAGVPVPGPRFCDEGTERLGAPFYLMDRVAGEAIPLAARIFAVVDVWDALRSDRPYRKAWPEADVRAHLRKQAGSHFDPAIVDAFLSLLDEG